MRRDASCSARPASPAPTRPARRTRQDRARSRAARVGARDGRDAGGPGWTFLALPSMLSDLEPAVHDTDALFALHKLKMAEAGQPTRRSTTCGTRSTWEQDQLVDAVTRAPRTVVLSGDVHFSAEHARSEPDGRVHRVDRHLGDLAEPRRQDGLAARRRAQELRGGAAEDAARRCSGATSTATGSLVVEASTQLVSCQWWFVDSVLEPSDGLAMGREVTLPMHREGTEQAQV